MKKRLVLGGLLTLASGLRWFARESTSLPDADPSPPAGDADPTRAAATLRVPGGVLHLKPTTAAAFQRLPKDRSYLIDHEATLSETAGPVRRQGNVLTLQPTQGPAVTFRNQWQEIAGSTAASSYQELTHDYIYCGAVPATHQWLVAVCEPRHVTYFLVFAGAAKRVPTYCLIDQGTGERTNLLGRPVVSPDGRYLLSVNTDPDNDGSLPVQTGIELYALGPGAPRRLWARDPAQWGATEARWAGPRTVLLEQDHTPPNQGGGGPPRTYVEFTLPAVR